MLQRKAMAQLEFWKHNKTKQALLISGARQVGKTYLIRKFAKKHYKQNVEFNLVEDAALRDSLKKASSARDLMFRMSVASSIQLVPGKTLIFIDEVQECPEILTFIKFLVDEGDYDFILSGSMLGVELENIHSYPVGYLAQVVLYPLDFEEFCWANGLSEEALAVARSSFEERTPLPDYLHERLTGLFHRYLLVGGMPDAITAFIASNSIDQVRIVQDDIMTFYSHDISKYAPKSRRLVIKNIFDLIPSELSSQNRRFKLSSIENIKRYSQVQEEFLWLTKANVALAAYNIHAPISPLLISENHKLFKLFLSDVGLLTSRYPKEPLLSILEGKPSVNLGGIYENFVMQELLTHGFAPRYYSKRKIGEIDFVVEGKDGSITALEVKSGREYKSHAALNNALAVKEYDIAQAYVFAETNIERAQRVTYFPVYLVAFLSND
ncbi:MAG: AAA family ATPase [Coriobacteriia bacterium]|nr:AAA family ATPase [Coriobacteriia bacterium]